MSIIDIIDKMTLKQKISPSMVNLFSEALNYTLDKNIREILLKCSQGKSVPYFHIQGSTIITDKGNTYIISKSPMDLCNIIHDIINGRERTTTFKQRSPSTRSRRIDPYSQLEDIISAFAHIETKRLGKGVYHTDLLISCIYTALILGDITQNDISITDNRIISIKGINTEIPLILKKNE